MAPANSHPRRADVGLLARLTALPAEIRMLIISYMVARNARISLLTFTQRTQALCLPFSHNEDLLAIAQEQVIRQNRFFWPVNAPNITSLACGIAHLEIDLSTIIEGGDVTQPPTFTLPATDVAKINLLPTRFPRLETLVVNVDNTTRIAPRARYIDVHGKACPAAFMPETMTMERTWKIGELIQRVRDLHFPRWRPNLTLKRKVVFAQSVQSNHELISPDPTVVVNNAKYAKALYQILDWPVSTVYFCKRKEEVW